MLRYSMTRRPDGSIVIKVGRKSTVLSTSGEADAFIAGFKTAHIKLSEAIAPFLELKDSSHE